MHEHTTKLRPFFQIESTAFFGDLKKQLVDAIEQSEKNYILQIDEEEFKSYLFKKFCLDPLGLYISESEVEDAPTYVRTLDELRNKMAGVKTKQYTFSVKVPFSGSPSLFKLKPSKYEMVGDVDIHLQEEKKIVSVLVTVFETDATRFENQKQLLLRKAFANVKHANSDASQWNDRLPKIIEETFRHCKSGYLRENKFFEEIKLKVNKNTTPLFSVPAIKKIDVPKVTPGASNRYAFEPHLSNEIYEDILKVLYTAGKSMERKPSLYQNRDEESLRDLFVFLLETRYESTTATGETFNKSGKTDIILKYQDGTNLFVAECKFWKGVAEYHEAISQLFDRYLTWRDSKVALMMFVKNKGMQNVIDTIRQNTAHHPYHVRETGTHGETSFSYLFRLPEDSNKTVKLEVVVFHYIG